MNELDKNSTISSGYQILALLMLYDSDYLRKSNMTATVRGILLSSASRIIQNFLCFHSLDYTNGNDSHGNRMA
jgi:hypothetical protein